MFQVAFVDLDDTLFSSLRKQPSHEGLEPAASCVDGRPVSFTSPRQRMLIDWLRRADLVVPVTARTIETFGRVELGFGGPAVVAHGASILDAQGRQDTGWSRHIAGYMQRELPPLLAFKHELEQRHGAGLEVSIAGAPASPAYLVAREPGRDEARIREVSAQDIAPWVAAHPGYTHHVNGRNLAVLPPCVDKRHAVAHLIERLRAEHGALFCIGAGDSLTDVPFLSLCDVALLPSRSQAWSRLQQVHDEACP